MSDIQPGDLVVCVDASQCACCEPCGASPRPLVQFRAYRVLEAVYFCDEGHGIIVDHAEPNLLHEAFKVERFRKIDRADESFSTWMKSLRPIKERVGA
jgi:hypothetical protein